MIYEMTDEQWEKIPLIERSSFLESEEQAMRRGVDGWVPVKFIDKGYGPYGACHKKHAKRIHWKDSAPPQEITIAVWADGEVRPISVPPEQHIEEAMANDLAFPERYEIWEHHGLGYSHVTTRRVEMRPVVLP